MSKRAVLLALLVGAAWVAGPRAQTPENPRAPDERVDVVLRLLDVVVTDGKGRPITGLGPEDFEVRVEGTVRPVSSFDSAARVIAGGPPSPASEPAPDPSPAAARATAVAADGDGRSVAILLDADRIPRNYRKIVLETARGIVRDSGGPRDRFAIVLLRNGELRFLQEFVPRDQVHTTLLEDPGMLLGRADDLRYRLDELVALVEGCNEVARSESCVLTRSEEFLAVVKKETRQGLESIRGLIAAMAPLPGRKALIWFSNGLLLEPGQVVLDAATRYVGDTRYLVSRLEDRASWDYEALMSEATRAGVSVFSLRAGTGMGQALRGADRAWNPRRLAGEGANPYRLATAISVDSLRDVADATGGRLILTPLKPALAPDLLDQLDAIYTLGIQPGPGDRPGSRVKIKLSTKKGKVRLRPRLPVVGRAPKDLVVQLSELTGAGGTGRGVGVTVSLDLRSVEAARGAEGGDGVSRVALFARLLDSEGQQVDLHYRIFEIPRAAAASPEFEYLVPFAAPPGDYRAEVTVSDLIGKGLSSAVMDIRR